MKLSRWLLPLVLAVLLLTAGCGVSAEQYEAVARQSQETASQLAALQSQMTGFQNQAEAAAAEKQAVQKQLNTAELEINRLKQLQEESALTGATPAETAAKIVRHYYDTHTYSAYDIYDCSDMASDVWNMLKKQGIGALLMVGDTGHQISDITQSTHAWVVAEVEPGKYLALEATNGTVVTAGEKPGYYRGWSFDAPKDFKDYQQLRREWNIQVTLHNAWITEANLAAKKPDAERFAFYRELIDDHESVMDDIEARINSLATKRELSN